MLSLTLVVFAEKVFPYGVRISAAVGVALIAIGFALFFNSPGVPERFLRIAPYRLGSFCRSRSRKICRLDGKILFYAAAYPNLFWPGNLRRCSHFLPI